jgi:hypothetical protein
MRGKQIMMEDLRSLRQADELGQNDVVDDGLERLALELMDLGLHIEGASALGFDSRYTRDAR